MGLPSSLSCCQLSPQGSRDPAFPISWPPIPPRLPSPSSSSWARPSCYSPVLCLPPGDSKGQSLVWCLTLLGSVQLPTERGVVNCFFSRRPFLILWWMVGKGKGHFRKCPCYLGKIKCGWFGSFSCECGCVCVQASRGERDGVGGCHKHSGMFCPATQDVMTHFVWSFPQWGGHVCTETRLASCLAPLRANGKAEEWRDGGKVS